MALSFSDTRYQDGVLFHPAAVAFSVRAASDSGLWVANIVRDVDGRVGAERFAEPFFVDVEVGPLRCSRRIEIRGVRIARQERRRERLLHAGTTLADIKAERRQVDQGGHVV